MAGLLVVLLGIEGLLHLLAAAVPRVDDVVFRPPPIVPDPVLEHRPRPHVRDHDAAGFRNPAVLRSADVVALGDSQTYGAGVDRHDETWPHRLAALHGWRVYSMAYGGYGPTEYRVLFDEAVTRQPKAIVVGFYLGNDLPEAYDMVYRRGQLPRLRTPEPRVLRRLEAAETTIGPLDRGWLELTRPTEAPGAPRHLRRVLAERGGIYGLARATYRSLRPVPPKPWDTVVRHARSRPPEVEYPVALGPVRTVLTVGARHPAVDLDDPRIAEALRVSLAALAEMHERAEAIGCRLLVAFIPTKERVFAPLVRGHRPEAPARLAALADDEAAVVTAARAHFDSRGIAHVDTCPALRRAIEHGTCPYAASIDGHPNAAGHAVLAEVIGEAVAAGLGPGH